MSDLEALVARIARLAEDAGGLSVALVGVERRVRALDRDASAALAGSGVPAAPLHGALGAAGRTCRQAADRLQSVRRTARRWCEGQASPRGSSGAAPPTEPASNVPTGPITVEELRAVAERFSGGGELSQTITDVHGDPLFVPHGDPGPALRMFVDWIAEHVSLPPGTEGGQGPRPGTFINSARTVGELRALARATLPDFRAMMDRAAGAAPGASTNYGPGNAHALKGEARLVEKVETGARLQQAHIGGSLERWRTQMVREEISDAIRGTIEVDGPGDIEPVVAALNGERGGLIVASDIDDKWHELDLLYFGVHADLLLQTPDGGTIRAEVQIHPRCLLPAKDASHLIYEKTRAAGPLPDAESYDRAMALVWLAGMCRLLRTDARLPSEELLS